MDKIEQIRVLKNVIAQRKQLEREERIMCRPSISNSMAEQVYTWCNNYLIAHYELSKIERRRYVLYVLLAYMCPRALTGERIARGLRNTLSKVAIGYTDKKTAISLDIPKIVFQFEHYSSFREVCIELITYVEGKLIKNTPNFLRK